MAASVTSLPDDEIRVNRCNRSVNKRLCYLARAYLSRELCVATENMLDPRYDSELRLVHNSL